MKTTCRNITPRHTPKRNSTLGIRLRTLTSHSPNAHYGGWSSCDFRFARRPNAPWLRDMLVRPQFCPRNPSNRGHQNKRPYSRTPHGSGKLTCSFESLPILTRFSGRSGRVNQGVSRPRRVGVGFNLGAAVWGTPAAPQNHLSRRGLANSGGRQLLRETVWSGSSSRGSGGRFGQCDEKRFHM